MNAEQYRALVKKLEAIQEAEAPDAAAQTAAMTASNTAPVPADGTSGGTQGDFAPVPADPNQIPTIEAPTFSQAYAQAKKQGLKKFKWCGVYAVKDKPKPPQPQPVKPQPGGIQPAVYVPPIQPRDFGGNQNQADTLNLVAAGNMGA